MTLRFKKIITIGLATIFSVGASIMAVSAATLPNIPIQNAKFVSEDRDADNWIGNGRNAFGNETFKTGFAFYIHGGKISYQMWQNDCGTGIGSNGVENQLGPLKVIKESN